MKRNTYKAEVNKIVYPNLVLAADATGIIRLTLQTAVKRRYRKNLSEMFEITVKGTLFKITVYPAYE